MPIDSQGGGIESAGPSVAFVPLRLICRHPSILLWSPSALPLEIIDPGPTHTHTLSLSLSLSLSRSLFHSFFLFHKFTNYSPFSARRKNITTAKTTTTLTKQEDGVLDANQIVDWALVSTFPSPDKDRRGSTAISFFFPRICFLNCFLIVNYYHAVSFVADSTEFFGILLGSQAISSC